MLTKNELKYYASLNQKKFRNKENKFIVEGIKVVGEGLNSSFKCETVFVTNQFFEENREHLQRIIKKNLRLEIIKNPEFIRLTDTINPQGIAAVFNKPGKTPKVIEKLNSRLVVCLENISDPGNLGAIIRNCDWFGINEVLLTEDCADIYNPKTIRSAMGSIFHINILKDIQIEKLSILKNNGYNLICTDLNGDNIYTYKPSVKSVVVFSNEASGPSGETIAISDKKVTIPRAGHAESLNVACASAVILSIFTC
jgi:TrmH family RNA methyltransferase